MIKLAVIGCGGWGKNLARNFNALPDADLKYICDVDPAVRTPVARAYPGSRVVADYATVLADRELDAAVVSVEEPLHFVIARDALRAGKHVFIEKPMALCNDDAAELVDMARERNLTLMVGHLLRYHPAVAFLRQMITSGDVGRPLYLCFQRVNLGVVRSSENAWWSLAPHDVSLACHFFDAVPVSVSATGQAFLQEGIEDVVFANLKFADGRMAHIHVSWLDPHKIRKVTLVGSQKMVVFDDMEAQEKVRIYDKGADVRRTVESYVEAITLRTGDIYIPRVPSAEPLRRECQHFVDCVENGKTPDSDGIEGQQVVRVLEAGSLSIARGGAPVSL